MIITTEIDLAKRALLKGEIIGIPTETVYGLAALMHNKDAVNRIFEVKNRPQTNPLIIHCHSIEQIKKYVLDFPEELEELALKFWPGPLTLLLPKTAEVPEYVTANQSLAAFRIPNHPLAIQLLKAIDQPLVAPSANPSNRISPTTVHHVKGYFEGKITLSLDGGPCAAGIESTIIGIENGRIKIYRPGTITEKDLAFTIEENLRDEEGNQPIVPGSSALHYAPSTPLYIIKSIDSIPKISENIGVILFGEHEYIPNAKVVTNLSKLGNLNEAACHLYATLHHLDQLKLDMIFCVELPNLGIGKSINNRLQRAGKRI